MSMLRFKVAKEAFSRKAVPVNELKERPSEYFGKYVFNREKMFKYLPKKTYEAVIEAIDNSTPLSREVADSVAAGMRKWALEMGATHYTHWFHPLTDGTAEKHDSFIEHDGKGGVLGKIVNSTRTRCFEFSEWRYSQYFRSSGIFGMGYIFSCIHSR
jgi:glutamine synthetase